MKTLKDYILDIIAEDSNMATTNGTKRKSLLKAKSSNVYNKVNREVSMDELEEEGDKIIDIKVKKNK